MAWGIVTLIATYVLSLMSAVLIYRRSRSVVVGVAGGFLIGAVGWFTGTMLFWYFQG
jgi:hypothetical protein